MALKTKLEHTEDYAKAVLTMFKPWLESPIQLKTHTTWAASLLAWSHDERRKSDPRWYLDLDENLKPVSVHPILKHVEDMHDGKDRAKKMHDASIAKQLEEEENENDINPDTGTKFSPDLDEVEDDTGLPDCVKNRAIVYPSDPHVNSPYE